MWLRTKNKSVADSLQEAFEELLTLHRLNVPARLRKTLMSTNPIESMFSLVRHSERNIKRSRGSAMLKRWLGTVLLYCEKQFVTAWEMVVSPAVSCRWCRSDWCEPRQTWDR